MALGIFGDFFLVDFVAEPFFFRIDRRQGDAEIVVLGVELRITFGSMYADNQTVVVAL